MGRIFTGFLVASAALVFVSGAFAQTKEDQNCIKEVNKNLSKIAKTVHKEGEKCIKDQSNGKNASAQGCIDADAKGKQAKAKQKASDNIPKKCIIATPLLDDMFGSDNNYGQTLGILAGAIVAVQEEGVDKETRLLQQILGSDIDAAVIPKSSKDAAKCQQALLKQFFKCQDTKLKEYEKCKKLAMKGGASTGQAIENACMGTGTNAQPDDKGKIAKACVEKVNKAVDKKCTHKGIDPDTVLPGNCLSSASGDTIGCIETMVECDVCSSINAVDGGHRDCDLFDNGLADQSCGACRNALDQVAVTSIGGTEALCILGCAGDPGCLASCNINTTDPTCESCLESTTVCSAFGAGSVCISTCLGDAQGIPCQSCLRAAGCLDCFGIAP